MMWWRRTPAKILEQPKARWAVGELYSRIKRGRTFEQLSRAEQVLVLALRLRDEVLNGTVWQYLSNSSGDLFYHAVRALDEMGAGECSGALKDVAAWFPQGEVPADRATRNVQMAAIEDATPEFEKRLREVNDRIDEAFPLMYVKLVAYLKEHTSELR
ncbi:DUF4375 domain-containing protein [Prosthecobacter sp.]|uniref:DMP19 family protein n=1 Tax=Prosthecobacter sp. TaxID=1965333 RepID=UPI003783EA28